MKNKSVFGIAFLLVGIQSIFVIRDFIPVSKEIFTYAIVGAVLIFSMNYGNFLRGKIVIYQGAYIQFLLLMILLLFTIFSAGNLGLSAQTIYLFILLYICVLLWSLDPEDLVGLVKAVLVVSSFSVYIAFILTPTEASYWASRGGRFYLGDTRNPGLVSVMTSLNIISMFLHFYTRKIEFIDLILYGPLLLISPYLYFISEGKSTILGLLGVILYLIFVSFKFGRTAGLYKATMVAIPVLLLAYFLLDLEQFVLGFYDAIVGAVSGLLGLDTGLIEMSAVARNDNFKVAMIYLDSAGMFGHGMNTFRMDSPILQAAVDFGIPVAIIFAVIVLIYPLVCLLTIRFYEVNDDFKMAILLYIFFAQNLLFHGMPYDYSIWIPVLIVLKYLTLMGVDREKGF